MFVVFFLPLKSIAVNLDSLLQVSISEKDPKIKCDKYLFYINKLSRENRDSAVHLLLNLEEESTKNGFVFAEARARSQRAYYLFFNARYEEGLKLLHQSLAQQKRIQDTLGMASTLNKIGLANMHFKRFSDAKNYMDLSLRYFYMYNDSSKIDLALNNLGVLYNNQGKYPESIVYFKKALDIRKAQQNYYWMAYAYYNIAESFMLNNQVDSSGYYLLLSYDMFQHKTETGVVPPMIYLGLGHYYYDLGQYSKAINYTELGIQAADKIDQTPLQMEGKKLLSDLHFKRNQFKEAYLFQSEFIDLKNRIDSSNNIEKVTEVEEKYKNAEKETEIAKLASQKLEAENSLKSFQLIIVTVAAIFLVLIAVFIIIWQRRNQLDRINQADLNTKIAEAKMFALRAQMNPHFIFNCINTAQNFVMNNQREQAYEYMSDFAKLLRLVMENSAKTFIPLDDELKQLKLYLELEKIRFNHKFLYEVKLDDNLKSGVFEIPGMIIQPIVENAIGHGLINRNDDAGELLIEVQKEEDCIVCIISDNGIGRKRAAEIKAIKEIKYQSAAIPNINERLAMLKKETDLNISLDIDDIVANGQVAGTKVTIRIPYQ